VAAQKKNRRVPKLKSSSQAGRTWLELLHAWANALGNSDRSAIRSKLSESIRHANGAVQSQINADVNSY